MESSCECGIEPLDSKSHGISCIANCNLQRFHNEELHSLYLSSVSPDVVRMIKSRRLGGVEHSARMKKFQQVVVQEMGI